MTTDKSRTMTIKEMKNLQRGIKIVLQDDKAFLISRQAYTEGYFYPGKTLSKEEMAFLRKADKTRRAENYLSVLLSQYRLTEKQVQERLRQKYSLSPKEIESLLLPYRESGVIDDSAYAKSYWEEKAQAGYGRRYLENQLRQRGIPEETLKEKALQDLLPLSDKALDNLIKKQNQAKKNMTLSQRKEKIFAFLLRRGYSASEAKHAIEKYFAARSTQEKQAEDENHRTLLIKEAEKCYNHLSHQAKDGKKKKDAFIRKLLSLGFDYEEICCLIHEKEYQFHD